MKSELLDLTLQVAVITISSRLALLSFYLPSFIILYSTSELANGHLTSVIYCSPDLRGLRARKSALKVSRLELIQRVGIPASVDLIARDGYPT
jgi:hypothetical protein